MATAKTWLRRAGRGTLADGATLIWSAADGERGRRWRATSIVDGRLTHAVMLETSPGGRIVRLELATASGLLTLHPAADGRSMHGNIVHVGGVRPLSFAWGADHELEIVDRPGPSAVMLRRLAKKVEVGGGETVPVLSIDASLVVRPGTRLVRRLAPERWLIADVSGGRETTIELDADGIPVLGASADWQLDA
ncbi:MAG TPA: hypothetical protein VF323_01375 [Candidatus Limnocylindrales bacterium]